MLAKVSLLDGVLLAVVAVLLLILAFKGCGKNTVERRYDDLIASMADTVKYFNNKDGGRVAEISVLQTERAKDFINLKTKDTQIVELQKLVKTYKSKLDKAGSSATVTHSTTTVGHTGETVTTKTDTIKGKDSLVYIYPTYQDTLDNKWIHYIATMNKDSSSFILKMNHEYSTVIGYNKKKPFADVISYSPYDSVTTTRTYQVSLPKPKKWTVSIFAGYGIPLISPIKLAPIVGVGVGRTIFRF